MSASHSQIVDLSLEEIVARLNALAEHQRLYVLEPVSERGTSKADKRDAARWRILEHGCQWVSFTETNGETHSFDPRNVTGYQGDLKSMRKFADEIMERQLNILHKETMVTVQLLAARFDHNPTTKTALFASGKERSWSHVSF